MNSAILSKNIPYHTALPQDDIVRVKTKMRCTCEKYSCVSVPYKYRKVVNDLSKNKNIVIMKQDKGREVIRDREKFDSS